MKPKILVVDDERLVRKVIARELMNDYDVIEAGSAAEALAIVAANPAVHAMTVDQRLGDARGDRLLEQIEALRPGIASVLISGAPPRDSRADGVVSKPWSFGTVLSAVRSAVGARVPLTAPTEAVATTPPSPT